MAASETGFGQYMFKDQSKVAGYAPVASTDWSIAVTQNSDEFLILAKSIRKFNTMRFGVAAIGISRQRNSLGGSEDCEIDL